MKDNKQKFEILLQENTLIKDTDYIRLYMEYETNHGYLQEESVKYTVENVTIYGLQEHASIKTYDNLAQAHIVFQSY